MAPLVNFLSVLCALAICVYITVGRILPTVINQFVSWLLTLKILTLKKLAYRFFSIFYPNYAGWLLGITVLLVLPEFLEWLGVLGRAQRRNADRHQLHQYEISQDASISTAAEGAEPEANPNWLEEKLAEVTSKAETSEKQCKLLESRLIHEQHKCASANGHIKQLLRQQSDVSILGQDPSQRKTRIQYIREALLSLSFLHRFSQVLTKNLAEATRSITHLTAEIKVKTGECTSLRLDNSILSLKIEHQTKKIGSCREQLDGPLSETHGAAHPVYSVSVLWRYSRYLVGQIARHSQDLLLVKADLAVARTKYNNLKSRYDALFVDCEQSCNKVAKLGVQLRNQTEELTELRSVHATLKLANEKATEETSQTGSQLKETVMKYDALQSDHAELMCRYDILETRAQKAEKRCQELEDESVEQQRASGLTIALLAHHVEQERLRMEENKMRGLRPVHEMMLDLRLRLATADEYVRKMVHEPEPTKHAWFNTPLPTRGALPSPPDSAHPSPLRLACENIRDLVTDPFTFGKPPMKRPPVIKVALPQSPAASPKFVTSPQ
ncbi:hypothetical protein EW146_g4571 [Bondarzewia mesenterica]|uniref:Uncharacterized protein n=1 Tax=Bondarzewia mesenterica TaxID=1095465 RepID=A0A4S4LV88_9AGAM|nr:hypothetical protein EW146_g4571 [Bondarzewia mesenterica]